MGDNSRCPFCAEHVAPTALVCPECARDIAIPPHLRAEHAELTRIRDRLRADLETARASIASRAPWFGSR